MGGSEQAGNRDDRRNMLTRSTTGVLRNNSRMLLALLNEGQRFEIQVAFSMFDKNGNGRVEPQEIVSVMNRLGLHPSREQVIDIINAIDLDHNGQVEFSEFAAVMARRLLEQEGQAEIAMALQLFEPLEGTQVEVPHLQELLTSTGCNPLSEQEFAQLMKVADPQGTGTLDYERFKRLPCWERPETGLSLDRKEAAASVRDMTAQ